MTNDNPSDERAVVPVEDSSPKAVLPLGSTTSVDLSQLPEEERNVLMVAYAQGQIDINKKAQELGIDVMALDNTLKALSETTRDVSEAEDAVTITHTQETSIGRTEIIMGNTDHAQKGRLTKTQTGEKDWTPIYVIGGGVAVAALLLAVVLSNGG